MKQGHKRTPTDIVRDSVIADMLFPCLQISDAELVPFLNAGFTSVSITVATDENASPLQVITRLAQQREYCRANSDRFILTETVDDIIRAKLEGKLAIGFNFQGTEPLSRDISLIDVYYRLGVRSMILSYNYQNNVGTGCIEGQVRDSGLSQFGKAVIAEMNKVGMLVDLSHTGHRTTLDAIEYSSSPCIFTHSNAKALFTHPRNIHDDQIRAVARTGGMIGITGVGAFVGDPKVLPAESLFKHLDYMVQMVGPQHIGLGLDYMSPSTCDVAMTLLKGDFSKLAMPSPPPWEFFHPTRIVELIQLMIDHGYPTEDIKGILGGNFLSLAKRIWR